MVCHGFSFFFFFLQKKKKKKKLNTTYTYTYLFISLFILFTEETIEVDVELTPEEQIQMLLKSHVNQYVDLKMNVHISHQNRNLIGEIQFLLQPILETQQKCHRLYELVRVRELLDYCDLVNFPMEEDLQVAIDDSAHYVELVVTKPVEVKYMLTHEPIKIKVLEEDPQADTKSTDDKKHNPLTLLDPFKPVTSPTHEVMKAVCCNTHNETSQTMVNTLLWEVLSMKKKTADPLPLDRQGLSLLHHAALSADRQMMDAMCGMFGQKQIEKFFNAVDKQGRTPWMVALATPRKDFLRYLLDKFSKCINWSLSDNKGDNVLHYVLSFCDDEILQQTVPKIDSAHVKKIVNTPNKMGETPLMCGCKNAILENQVRTIQVFCEQFASTIDWNQKSKFGRNYLHFPVNPGAMQCITKVLSQEQRVLFLNAPDDDVKKLHSL
ncbi:hypothetical protein RFI_27819 [Reticulomyxa filosa]|uniref:Ankyrin repeat protein n=1 Tax=Reticulomyxa filosa TaxID=46433 RepID=X6M6M0_RETFI|nr:hypothetical protein RFI_27819 [Reticulomyxa filosa]|eukprot:ETO09559.1 hypothetical protein RFI_27819 [Reticulomyxa filosa]